jgi:hypothetical protein
MVRRVQLGAGIAAGILGMVSLAVLLFAPLVPYCRTTTPLPCASVRYDSLLHLGMDTALRTYLLGMLGLLLVGAGCAIAEARGGQRGTRAALWIVTVLALAGSAYTVHGPGLLFLPAVLVLCLANYASLACRLVEWRQARTLCMLRTEAQPDDAPIAGPSPAVAGEGTADIATESAERPLSA